MEDFKTPGFSTGRRGSSMRPVDSRQTAADTADEPGTMNPRSNNLAAYAKRFNLLELRITLGSPAQNVTT